MDPLFRGVGLSKNEKRAAHRFLSTFFNGSEAQCKQFDLNLDDFEVGTGVFGEVDLQQKGSTLSQAQWWCYVECVTDTSALLSDMGKRLGSIPSSSASSERVWSTLGNIHTKTRNRLKSKTVEKLGVVHYNLVSVDQKRLRRDEAAAEKYNASYQEAVEQ